MDYFNQESERLKFRKLTVKDIPVWEEFFQNNDRLRFLGLDQTKSHGELATDWIERQLDRYEKTGIGQLAIIMKDTNVFVGVGGIVLRELNKKTVYEIGYSILPKFWNMGFATEAAIQMKKTGISELKLPRLVSIIAIDNFDSKKVARKNGMDLLEKTIYMGVEVEVFG